MNRAFVNAAEFLDDPVDGEASPQFGKAPSSSVSIRIMEPEEAEFPVDEVFPVI